MLSYQRPVTGPTLWVGVRSQRRAGTDPGSPRWKPVNDEVSDVRDVLCGKGRLAESGHQNAHLPEFESPLRSAPGRGEKRRTDATATLRAASPEGPMQRPCGKALMGCHRMPF